MAAACFVALAVPMAVGWGCARADAQLEAVSAQPVRILDLLLVAAVVGGTAAVALVMHAMGVARPVWLPLAHSWYGGFLLLLRRSGAGRQRPCRRFTCWRSSWSGLARTSSIRLHGRGSRPKKPLRLMDADGGTGRGGAPLPTSSLRGA